MLTNIGKSKKEIRIRLATAITVGLLVKLEKTLRSGEINFKFKYRLYNSLVLSTLLYGCESWTLLEVSKKNISSQMNISYII